MISQPSLRQIDTGFPQRTGIYRFEQGLGSARPLSDVAFIDQKTWRLLEERFSAMITWSPRSNADGANHAVKINTPSREALLSDLRHRLTAGGGFSVATLNLDHVVKLKRDSRFRSAYEKHTHVVADGNPIVWLSRLSGERIELAAGSELVDPILEIAAELGTRVAFVGSTEEALQRAANILSERYPDLEIVALISPEMGFNPEGPAADEAIAALSAAEVQLCLLALGAPRQECFAAYAQTSLPRCGFLSIGAGLDFIAGRQKRAPRLVRLLAVEWLWRLISDPRRLAGRYLACIAILPGLTWQAFKARRVRQ